MTKAELYESIDALRGYFDIGWNDYPVNAISCCKNTKEIKVEQVPFTTRGLRGMAVVGERWQDDIILLNEHRSLEELNFDCGHELMHLYYHRNIKKTFNCFEKILPQQNSYVEWQANEGAAEFLVPYELFLPLVKKQYPFDSWQKILHFKREASEKFRVSESVISHRLDNLKYEIDQYLNNVALKDVVILSKGQQELQNIHVQSINDIENIFFDNEFRNWHIKIGAS